MIISWFVLVWSAYDTFRFADFEIAEAVVAGYFSLGYTGCDPI